MGEILRDDGTPRPPGEDGRIVVTGFINYGTPMLRYEVGDRGVLHDQPCPRGRPHPLLRRVTGRTAAFLVADALTREFRESLGKKLSGTHSDPSRARVVAAASRASLEQALRAAGPRVRVRHPIPTTRASYSKSASIELH